MNEFLSSVKADLLDRNRLPYLIALCVALAAVLAYGVLGGSSTSTPPQTSGSASETASGGIPVSPAPSAADASASAFTTATQSNPPGRDFFEPLPGANAEAAKASTTSSSASAKSASSTAAPSSSSSSSGSSTQKSSSSTPSQPATQPKPATPSKPKPKEPTYEVSLLFGVFSAPPAISQLTPYPNVKRGLQLPSPQVALVTFSGWTTGGASATFTLSGEAIIHGPAVCVPSPQECTSITLKPGEAEQLQYVTANGPTTTYELQVVSITLAGQSASASAARAHGAHAHAARRRGGHRS